MTPTEIEPVGSLSVDTLTYVTELIWPDFVEYEGMVFRSGVATGELIQQWLSSESSSIQVQSTLNRLHFYDLVTDEYEDVMLPALELAARRVAEAWRSALALRFPDRRFEIVFRSEPDDYGPTLFFYEVK